MTQAGKISFRDRLHAGERLTGTFLKTPALATIEILALAGLDFIVIDEEHAPIDRASIDAAIFACRAVGVAAFVRVGSATPSNLLSVLDCGAMGVLVPHVDTEAKARAVAAACRYSGGRGYSGAVRSSGYGTSKMAETLERNDTEVLVIAQIEDEAALGVIDSIAAVDGIDALFIGRGDLAVSMGEAGSDSNAVRRAAERIADAARLAGKPVSVFAGTVKEAQMLAGLGATMFVFSSDQGFLRQAATAAVTAMQSLDIAVNGAAS